MVRRRTILIAVGGGLTAAAIVGAVVALTATNTIPASRAGVGSGDITGYVVSSVHYTFNAADPNKVDQVAFTLDSAPVAGSSVRARLDPAGSWYDCTFSGTAVTCNTTSPQAMTATATSLTVAVAQ